MLDSAQRPPCVLGPYFDRSSHSLACPSGCSPMAKRFLTQQTVALLTFKVFMMS
ncbi:Uncharacterized protein FKW44_024903 [Caligus rogercresseyi]|uniref:Uncharacterized protein n=1 Tax=Caligus rogercresseyi TaxID=217165 RepID=A0A7T8JT52_CALRO|nr:Uncharacterized protein FKW44_024903 [Caligus rogercresseyi]